MILVVVDDQLAAVRHATGYISFILILSDHKRYRFTGVRLFFGVQTLSSFEVSCTIQNSIYIHLGCKCNTYLFSYIFHVN